MAMLITNLLRNTIQATNLRPAFKQFSKRSLSTDFKTSAEKAQASIESQQAILGKIHSYMEENSHGFGGWYYAVSLTGIAVGIIGTGIFRSSKILDKRIEDATKDIRKDIGDIRKDMGNLEKNISEMRSDIREMRSFMMQQYRQPVPAENTRQFKL